MDDGWTGGTDGRGLDPQEPRLEQRYLDIEAMERIQQEPGENG